MRNLVADSSNNAFNFNFFLILFEAASRFPEFLKLELKLHKKDIKAWKSIISVAQKKGGIKTVSSDEEIANLFLYCTDGVFLRFINNDKPKAFKDFLLNTYDTIYKNLKI